MSYLVEGLVTCLDRENGLENSFLTLTVAEVNWQCFCLAGLAAPAAAFTSAPYVINAQEPYVGALITGEQPR